MGDSRILQNSYSAGIDFSRQNLTSVDVRFWRLNSIPALEESTDFYWPETHNIGIQMNQKELTKTLWWFQNEKNTFGYDVFFFTN